MQLSEERMNEPKANPMPLPSWLRALLPRHRADAPAADKVAQVPQSPAVTQPPSAPETDLQSLSPDNGVRMHIAAHDPEFPAKREAAVETILAAIDPVAARHGFTKKAKSWARSGPLGTVSLHLQRSRYGFDCHINLGFQPLTDAASGPWALDDFVRLGRFFPYDPGATTEPDTLTYLDVMDDPAILDRPLAVLQDQALPWLLAHLTDPNAASLPLLRGPTAVP